MHLNTAPCANSQYLAAYLREEGKEYRRTTWAEKEAESMLTQMQPLNPDAIDEALSEVMNSPKSPDRAAVLAAFAGSDNAALGTAVRAAVSNYWLAYCKTKAEEAYDDGAAEPDSDAEREALNERREMAYED
ncbi:hypothetical protein [Cupriavidus sp. UYPR2.512]|uniref:hypothetical protein n=1 Tax=Cupriavidus sp. UYPR2.512 TaxID=1080187 RepID=UPI00036416E8|nr:hypothetical protein [Cupriavidus sp. UYPR2.512]UIF90896.1 hypothetical protein KAF44_32435 [Cupriavidus necator]